MAEVGPRSLKDLVARIGREDLFGAAAVAILLLLTVPTYVEHSLSRWWIIDDARQQVWTIHTLIDPSFPSDLYSRYMIDKTMPDAFVWLVLNLTRLLGSPELIFKTIGLLSFAGCAGFVWLSGRKIGGPVVGWTALALVFLVGGLAGATAGGLPRSVGVLLACAGFYAFMSERPWVAAVACVLGGLIYYPAGVICGALFALQLLSPQSWFEFKRHRSLSTRLACVAAIGALTAMPVIPDVLASDYGKLITATNPQWPEAGPDGRFSPDNLLGITRPLRVFVKALLVLRTTDAPWRPPSWMWDRIESVVSLLALAAMTLILIARARSDVAARRLLAIFALGGILFVIAIAIAPLAYVPTRYFRLWEPYAIVGLPYALSRLPEFRLKHLSWPIPATPTVMLGVLVLTALAGGPLVAQGLSVRPDASEQQLLAFLSTTAPNTQVAGWPTGMVNDVPYYANRRVLLSFELHIPWHEVYAKETRDRAFDIIAAWYSASSSRLYGLHAKYGTDLFVVDKALLPGSAEYFRPFDKAVSEAKQSLGRESPYVSRPDQDNIVFENHDYVVLSLLGKGGV